MSFPAFSKALVAAALCLCRVDAGAQPIEARVEMRGERVIVDVQATVAAPPAYAWAVLTDYDHMARYVSALKSSSVVNKSGNVLEVEQTGVARVGFMKFSFYSLRAVHLTPEREIHSQLIRGDFKSYEFTTRIFEKGANSLIIHHGEYVPNSWVPPGIGPSLIRDQTSKQYEELVAEILLRQRAQAPRSSAASAAEASRR